MLCLFDFSSYFNLHKPGFWCSWQHTCKKRKRESRSDFSIKKKHERNSLCWKILKLIWRESLHLRDISEGRRFQEKGKLQAQMNVSSSLKLGRDFFSWQSAVKFSWWQWTLKMNDKDNYNKNDSNEDFSPSSWIFCCCSFAMIWVVPCLIFVKNYLCSSNRRGSAAFLPLYTVWCLLGNFYFHNF